MAQKLKRVERNLYLDEDTGIYHVRAMVNGKAMGPFTTGHTTPKMALRKRDDIMSDLRKRAEGAKEIPTFAAGWADYRKRKTKTPATWAKQSRVLELHVLPGYGTTRLNDFTPATMEFYVQRRRKEGASDSSIALELKIIIAVLNDAWENGVIPRNPLRTFLRSKKAPKIAVRGKVLTPEEQDRLEAAAKPETRRYILFLLATGIRLEESFNIKPSEIDWTARQFHVVGKGNKGRWVPILAPDLLRTLVDEQTALTGKDKLWTAKTLSALKQTVVTAAAQAGMKNIGPHTMRHTFATRYLTGEKRGDIYTLSLILGHSSVTVTERHYAHLLSKNLVERSADVEVGVAYGGVKG